MKIQDGQQQQPMEIKKKCADADALKKNFVAVDFFYNI